MIIELNQFGESLTFRDNGREAFKAMQSLLRNLKDQEELVLDFKGVDTFSPSWGDEVITNLYRKYKDRLILKNTENASVTATLELLAEINNFDFNIK